MEGKGDQPPKHYSLFSFFFFGAANRLIVVLYFPDEIDAAVNLSFSFRTPSIS